MRPRRVAAALALALPLAPLHAQAPEPPARYTIKEDQPRTGTSLRQALVTSSLPLDKRYAELTPAQQAQVRGYYEALHPLDEPPFPADGLGPLMSALQKGASKLEAEGELLLYVTVGPDGNARSARLMRSPDPTFGEFALSAALLTRFKPALCRGEPCTMEYPVHQRFERVLR